MTYAVRQLTLGSSQKRFFKEKRSMAFYKKRVFVLDTIFFHWRSGFIMFLIAGMYILSSPTEYFPREGQHPLQKKKSQKIQKTAVTIRIKTDF